MMSTKPVTTAPPPPAAAAQSSPDVVPHRRRRRHRKQAQRASDAVTGLQVDAAAAVSPHQGDVQVVHLAPGVVLTRPRRVPPSIIPTPAFERAMVARAAFDAGTALAASAPTRTRSLPGGGG